LNQGVARGVSNESIILAKSDGETLKEHTEQLLSNLERLRKLYGQDLQLIGQKEWSLLELAAFYHDFGKVSKSFQNKVKNKNSKSGGSDIPHGILSPVFLDYEALKCQYSETEIKLLIHVIAHHHDREFKLWEIREKVKEETEAKDQTLNAHFGKIVAKYDLKNYFLNMSIIAEKNPFKVFKDSSERRKYILIKGLLNRLDYAASAHVDVEIRNEADTLDVVTYNWLKNNNFTLRPPQEFARQRKGQNIVLIASTGMGKTETALLWANGRKTFFTLPIRTSINHIYKRITEQIGFKDVGILHSTSLEFLFEKSKAFDGDSDEYYYSYKLARQFAYPLTVCTVDQLFTFPFRHFGFERILATLSYSNVIVDEIQAYTPKIAASILYGLKEIADFGGKFMVMSATIPGIYLDALENMGLTFETGEFYDTERRNVIAIMDFDISEDINSIVRCSKEKRVLVIVNTVRKAVELYEKIRNTYGDEYNVQLLHGLFTRGDRQVKEEKITNMREPGVWISTQIVEASLDIDFDILFTEFSSLDSLFQRMGRCYRKRVYDGSKPNVYVYTAGCSGIGKVYDKDVHRIGKEHIINFNGRELSGKEKSELVREVYSKEKLLRTKYYNEFNTALNLLKNGLVPYELEKNEVHKELRDVSKIEAIPLRLYEEHKDKVEAFLKEKDGRRKFEMFVKEISKMLVGVPYYVYKKGILKPLMDSSKGSYSDIYLLECYYDKEIGVRLDQITKSENAEFI